MSARKIDRPKIQARTQWAAQFLAASELARFDYTVSFTMGNHTPDADLMVGAPSGKQFWVDVKGLSSKSSWLVKEKRKRLNLFYILVYVDDDDRDDDRFFVLEQKDARDLIRRYRRQHPRNKNAMQGFKWTDPFPFEEAWAKLPR
jgi:hypothetical protein